MDKATSFSVLIVVTLMAFSITLAIVQQQSSGQTRRLTTSTNVNFAQLFEQKFASSSYLGTPGVSVVYQSPTTVILQGHAKTLNTKIALVNNQQI